jgi:hypothetical protein
VNNALATNNKKPSASQIRQHENLATPQPSRNNTGDIPGKFKFSSSVLN